MKNLYLKLLLLSVNFTVNIFSVGIYDIQRDIQRKMWELEESITIKRLIFNNQDLDSLNLQEILFAYENIQHAIKKSVSLRTASFLQNKQLKLHPELLSILVSGITKSPFLADAVFDKDIFEGHPCLSKEMNDADFFLQKDGITWHRSSRPYEYKDYFNEKAF